MQWERGTAPPWVVVVAAVVEAATLATPGEPPPPQPATSSETAANARGTARMSRGRRRTICAVSRVLSAASIQRLSDLRRREQAVRCRQARLDDPQKCGRVHVDALSLDHLDRQTTLRVRIGEAAHPVAAHAPG